MCRPACLKETILAAILAAVVLGTRDRLRIRKTALFIALALHVSRHSSLHVSFDVILYNLILYISALLMFSRSRIGSEADTVRSAYDLFPTHRVNH